MCSRTNFVRCLDTFDLSEKAVEILLIMIFNDEIDPSDISDLIILCCIS